MKLVVAAAIALAAANAPAGGGARLELERATGAERCPERAEFESTVAARLGAAPWSPTATRLVRVVFAPEGKRLVGRLELLDGAAVLGVREARSGGLDCDELAESLALAVAIALEPPAATPPRPASCGCATCPYRR